MNPTKTVKLAALVGVAALLLTACGSVTDVDAGPAGGESTSAECASTVGISDSEIKLGVLSDLSGPLAAGGVPFAQGAQAYIDWANDNLTEQLGGRKLSVTVKDTQYDPQKAISAYRELNSEVAGIPLSFGGLTTGAIAEQAQSDCLLVVANPGSRQDARPGVYYTGATYDVSVINLMDYYVNELGHKDFKIGIIYQVGGYGEGALAALKWGASQLGYDVVAAQSFAPTDKDFSGQLAAIRKAAPDVVLMASSGASTFSIFGAAEAAGADWEWLGLQPTFIPAVFSLPIGDAFQQKVTMVYGGPVLSQSGANLTAAADQLKKDFPDQVENPPALLGWQAAYLFTNAMIDAIKSDHLTRGGIRDAIASLSIDPQGLGPAKYAFDPSSAIPTEPDQADLIVKADADTLGGLKVVQDWTQSPLVDKYNAEAKR
ncbi:ABC transporter substrate-binding protein [Microbacterium luticocti]|uniref:ABC transporter substrate-binding protein n=1 Tax=Microbacterium luticocti TaxID=451764 RepID=UPI000417D3C8|nr:ABC transporter substrate-binding protein [Microbacterium luticocti]